MLAPPLAGTVAGRWAGNALVCSTQERWDRLSPTDRTDGRRCLMEVKGLAWAGTRTTAYDAMMQLFGEVMGLQLAHEDTDFAGFLLPNGDKVEVFGPSDTEHRHFDAGPVVGFLVEDVAAARAHLEATGMVEFIGPLHSWPGGTAWQHFRAPDGNVYELVGPPVEVDR
jgi:predicted enzyme related to lactoylglutathione lyase